MMKNSPFHLSDICSKPLDYAETMRRIEELTERYKFISASFIGSSLLGRGIPIVKLGNEEAKSAVLYVGAHHAMEWITTGVLLNFMYDYCELTEKKAKIYGLGTENLYSSRQIYIVPMLNPDGVELQINGIKSAGAMAERLCKMNNGSEDFTHWQANARGVDLNHNYDAGFNDYKKLERKAGITGGCATRYSGEFPESEPEVGRLCNFVRFNSEIKAALTLHTQGEEIYCAANKKTARRTMDIGALIAKMTGYKLAVPEEMASYGGMTDWFVGALGKPSFTVECGKGVNPLPPEDCFEIYARLREALFTFPILV